MVEVMFPEALAKLVAKAVRKIFWGRTWLDISSQTSDEHGQALRVATKYHYTILSIDSVETKLS